MDQILISHVAARGLECPGSSHDLRWHTYPFTHGHRHAHTWKWEISRREGGTSMQIAMARHVSSCNSIRVDQSLCEASTSIVQEP